jgi:hypothetical protein
VNKHKLPLACKLPLALASGQIEKKREKALAEFKENNFSLGFVPKP